MTKNGRLKGFSYFLLDRKKKFNSIGNIMPVLSDHLRSLFNRHRKTDLTKRVNTENAVRQSSRDSAINNNDNNFVT